MSAMVSAASPSRTKDLSSHLHFLDEKTCIVNGDGGHSDDSLSSMLLAPVLGTGIRTIS